MLGELTDGCAAVAVRPRVAGARQVEGGKSLGNAQFTPSANPGSYSKRSLRALCSSSSLLVSRSIVSIKWLLQLATTLTFSGPSASVN